MPSKKQMRNCFYIKVLLLFVTINISCSNDKFIRPVTAEDIKINLDEKPVKINFEDFFVSKKVIPLESNENSVISTIDRIALHNNKIFILDKKLNSVFVFNENGDFNYKINNVGRGPREYNSLTDFTIDKVANQLILYTDRPYAFFYYDIENGKFKKRIKLDDLYYNISMSGENILLYNQYDTKKKYSLFEYNIKENSIGYGLLKMNSRNKTYNTQSINSPYLINSKHTYLSFPYSGVIYEYANAKVDAKYYVDFGENTLPEDIYEEKKKFKDLFEYARKNKYGYSICEFRENKDFIVFKIKGRELVFYSKEKKQAKLISQIENDDMIYGYYLAHDGDDNKLVSVYTASNLKEQMRVYREKPEQWEKVPERIKKIDREITENDNPLLLIYTFKE